MQAAFAACWDSIMLFALGAASTAVEALKTLTSSAKSLMQSSSPGQGSADPFTVSSPLPGSGSSSGSPAGFGAAPRMSPPTMNALLAAQGLTSAPTSGGLNSSSSIKAGAATHSYNTAEQMVGQQRQAMALTA
jgi:hypothetical protein